jgi:hypothetical protein
VTSWYFSYSATSKYLRLIHQIQQSFHCLLFSFSQHAANLITVSHYSPFIQQICTPRLVNSALIYYAENSASCTVYSWLFSACSKVPRCVSLVRKCSKIVQSICPKVDFVRQIQETPQSLTLCPADSSGGPGAPGSTRGCLKKPWKKRCYMFMNSRREFIRKMHYRCMVILYICCITTRTVSYVVRVATVQFVSIWFSIYCNLYSS